MLLGGVGVQEKKELNIKIGANIKREREKAGFTQEKFSELIGLGTKSLSAIERGTVGISITALCRVCKTLSISSDALLFGETNTDRTGDLIDRLEHLTPAQYQIASDMLLKLLEAFQLPNHD